MGDDLKAYLAELIGISPAEIADDDNLIRLGLESLHVMRLITKWRRADIPVTFGEMARTPTYSAWNERLTEALAARDTGSGS
ncbi:hypothetical protein QR77_16355 [Streptomyces sp. 150FB]|nr:hypothetical protein QR77_16355 [Streptomyces sp. 150FB]